MPDDLLKIRIEGDKALRQALRRAPQKLKRNLGMAGDEAAKYILATEGLQKYPPSGPGNQPPTPYYIRGRGTQLASYNRGESERYGTKWVVTQQGYKTVIGNIASYAKWLAGAKDQAKHMAAIGWRKLVDVAREKMPGIVKIYTKFVERALREAGLK